MQVGFGVGRMFGIPQGLPAGTATPVQLGALEKVQIEFSGDLKELGGSQSFSLDLARGKFKITGKASFAKINAATWNSLYFGQAVTTGQTLISLDELGTVPAAAPYTITVANGATFAQDLGVVYQNGNGLISQVPPAPGPAAAQYSQGAGGVYTFAAADAGAPVKFCYEYTGTGGYTMALINQDQGSVPTWKAAFTTKFRGKSLTLVLNKCGSAKLSFATKDDWTVPEMDFTAVADDSGNIGYLSFAE